MYEIYKNARNISWEVLYKCGITKLPVNLNIIADYYNIKILTYSKINITQIFKEDVKNGDGFIVETLDKNKVIFLNDKVKSKGRRRFTIAHELGHAIQKHDISIIRYRNSEIDNKNDIQEFEANIFARDILMPACVLKELNIHTVEEIMKVCDISKLSAEIRLSRLEKLYKRNAFYLNPMEIKVKNNFLNFINEYKQTHNKF